MKAMAAAEPDPTPAPARCERAGLDTVLGIGIVTYERRSLLEALLASVTELTDSPYELVVADDGSRDGSAEWTRDSGLRVVSGANRGVAWNKNRALFALAQLGCDPLVLLEDDALPVVRGWERDWIEGTSAWHHLACDPKVDRHAVSGTGTPADPFVSPAATGFCMSISARALDLVGYFDSRFRGYGHEHSDWTTRIKRAGYGFRQITLPDGRAFDAQLFLTGGLTLVKVKGTGNAAQARANRETGRQILGEPVFRRPWRTLEERSSFLAEQAAAEIDGSNLAAELDARPPASSSANPTLASTGRTGLDGRLEAVIDGIAVGWAYNWSDPGSTVEVEILVDGRLVASIAADVPRQTLAEAGLGDGRHGFSVELPSRIRDGSLHSIAAIFSTSRKPVDASGAFRTSVSAAAEEWTGTRFHTTLDGTSDSRVLRLRASHQAQFTQRTLAQGFAGGDAPETILLAEQTDVTRSRMLHLSIQRGVADPAGERHRRLQEHPPSYLAGRLLVSRLPGALVDTNRYLICPTERQYLVDSTRFRHPLPTWGYTHLADGVYEREVTIEEREERVVALGAQSNLNYSHWLVESVVRALLFRPFDDGSVMYLCPPLNRWQREALALAGVPDERLLIVPARRRRLLRFREVFAVSRGMSGIPLLIPGALSALTTLGKPVTRRRRLYVSRAQVQQRHISNEAELVEALERHGFETVHPQTLPVSEQIELFAGVEAVVGSFGSGLTNLIFSPPDTLVLELQPENLDFGGNAFVWNLTSIRDQRFAQVVSPVAEGMRPLPLAERDMTVDVQEIDELLGQLLER
jgi:hypothetical protein